MPEKGIFPRDKVHSEVARRDEVKKLFDISDLIRVQRLVLDNLYGLAGENTGKVFRDVNPDLFQTIDDELAVLNEVWHAKFIDLFAFYYAHPDLWRKHEFMEGKFSFEQGESSITFEVRKSLAGSSFYRQDCCNLYINSPEGVAVCQPSTELGPSGHRDKDIRFYVSKKAGGVEQTDQITVEQKSLFRLDKIVVCGERSIEPAEIDENNSWHPQTCDDYPVIGTKQKFRITACRLPEGTNLIKNRS